MSQEIADIYKELEADESFRDRLATVDSSGRRVWLYPKKPKGRLTNYRSIVSAILLLILFSGPFITIGGEPLLLFNILERKFVVFGQVFWPQDFHLAVIGMIASVVFIILFTVVFGRVFCGWICPQTIFMESVFRRIEYLIEGDYMKQKKLNTQSWNGDKIIKKGSKHLIFILISALIMHTFLAYLMGIDELYTLVAAGPAAAPYTFVAMIVLTLLFYGVFSRMREQVCTTICPYGRLQGVLLDQKSIVVAYDHVRGETRSKFRKGEDRAAENKGDCIDCHQCVSVCPTGIDIRNGTQMECVNCTACIDACDSIMDKIGKPRGLVRYASEENIAEKRQFVFSGRMKAYSAVLVLLIGLIVTLLVIRTDIETSLLRTPGVMYQERPDGSYSNLYQLRVVNKSNSAFPAKFELLEPVGSIEMVGEEMQLNPQEISAGALFIVLSPDQLDGITTMVKIGVYHDDELLETVTTKFLGPAL